MARFEGNAPPPGTPGTSARPRHVAMNAYDNLPPQLRQAVADARYPMSATTLHVSLHSGISVERLVGFIRDFRSPV